ncbi:MAG: hypothetical protein ACXW0Z_20150 [Gemmatirosa sp.]
MSQSVCPWYVRFAKELSEDSPFQPREALAGKDARQLAPEILGGAREELSRDFKGSHEEGGEGALA